MRWNAIHKRISDIKNPIGIEIGVYQGELSDKILSMNSSLTWIMVDSWSENTYQGKSVDAVSEKFKEIYQKQGEQNYNDVTKLMMDKYFGRSQVIKLDSLNAAELYPSHSFDIVFIDAAHDYQSVIDDLISWWRKVKPGGYISGHDYGVENFPGVKKAVDKFVGGKLERIELDDDFSWFVKKI